METLVLSVINALLFVSDLFIFFHPNVKLRHYVISFLFFTALTFLQLQFKPPGLLLVLLLLTSLYVTYITHKTYYFAVFPVCYIINCIAIYFVAFFYKILINYSIKELNSDFAVAAQTLLISILISACPVYALKCYFRKSLITVLENLNSRIVFYISISATVCAYLIYAILTVFDNINIPSTYYVMLIVLIILFFLLTTGSITIILFTCKKSFEQEQQIKRLEALRAYTRNLENVYNNLRSFKHDYMNIMSTLSIYIEEKRYDELKDYFYNHILPLKNELNHKNEALAKLARVNNLELKSILYTKFLMAVSQDIRITIDIPDEISDLRIDSIDLARILGIYLDNALEAAVETPDPAVSFHLGYLNDCIVCILSNSYTNHGLSISQMKQKDVSSKGSGHGLGLYNVSQILQKYDNLFSETSKTDDLFTQQLIIA